jgi:hypothetical protein
VPDLSLVHADVDAIDREKDSEGVLRVSASIPPLEMVDILSVGLVNSALWPNNVYEVWGDPKKNIKPYISLTFTDRADVFLNEDAKRKETRDQVELIFS